jgi:poly-gamma-glutamate capsule biosynthesis protein CapA/YwtB (metallophosphatase superfamily)
MKKVVHVIGITVLVLLAAIGCENTEARPKADPSVSPSPILSETSAGEVNHRNGEAAAMLPPAPDPSPAVYRAKLSAIGDILIHNTVYQDAYGSNGGYDFTPMLEPVRQLLLQPDLLIANQESLIGGRELGLSSYPMFNSPAEIGDALRHAGVDLVTTANNHTLDKGEKGVLAAAEHWDRIGLPYTGAFRSAEDREKLRVLEANGIRFAFLAYTYGTNGMPVPADKPYLVNLMEPDRVEREIRQAKQSADAAVVSVHWGVENEELPWDEQREWARNLAHWGADVIIGTHPHVVQPMEWIQREDGGRSLVMYSLGNFLSAQDRLPQLIGGIGQVEVVKTTAGGTAHIRLEAPSFIPTYNKYKNWRHYRVLPFSSLEQDDWVKIVPVWEGIKSRLVEAMPELQVAD